MTSAIKVHGSHALAEHGVYPFAQNGQNPTGPFSQGGHP